MLDINTNTDPQLRELLQRLEEVVSQIHAYGMENQTQTKPKSDPNFFAFEVNILYNDSDGDPSLRGAACISWADVNALRMMEQLERARS